MILMRVSLLNTPFFARFNLLFTIARLFYQLGSSALSLDFLFPKNEGNYNNYKEDNMTF